FLKPVLSWLEKLNTLKVELVKDEIFKKCSTDQYRTNLSIVKGIITKRKQTSWLLNILLARIEYTLKKVLRGNLPSKLTNQLNHLKRKLQIRMDPECLFLEIFGQLLLEYENRDPNQLEQNFSFDHRLLNELCFKLLLLWKLPLEKKILSDELDQDLLFKDANNIDKSITTDYLYKIGEEKEKDLLKDSVELIKNIEVQPDQFDLSNLDELLEELTFGGFALDKDGLNLSSMTNKSH
ncbi:unnamed protein product, partial [Rotaria magnacalcarata]